MEQYISKSKVVAEIEKLIDKGKYCEEYYCAFRDGNNNALYELKLRINTLEVIDPYEQCVQYDSIKAGIQAHAETYSFNIESELFNQLTKEQQKLWRKEIEQACVSGGEVGVELSRDPRYKENIEVKEVNLQKEIYDAEERFGDIDEMGGYSIIMYDDDFRDVLRHFYELGLKSKGE